MLYCHVIKIIIVTATFLTNYFLNQNLQITDGQNKANEISAETYFH